MILKLWIKEESNNKHDFFFFKKIGYIDQDRKMIRDNPWAPNIQKKNL